MRTPSNPGCGELFEEYFSNGVPGYLVTKGVHDGTPYRIYCRYKQDTEYASHYTVYVHFDNAPCTHLLEHHSLPRAPAHYGTNFGPTEDHWVGFGTLDGRDYNYHDDDEPFKRDYRTPQDKLLTGSTISEWTPTTLEESTCEWITSARQFFEETSCRVCD